jgi:hypothetical protein
MGRKEPIKGGENPIDGTEKQKEIKREEKRKREKVVEARGGWGGVTRPRSDHLRSRSVARVTPEEEERESRRWARGMEEEGGWRLGKGARVSDLEAEVFRESLGERKNLGFQPKSYIDNPALQRRWLWFFWFISFGSGYGGAKD